jgi:hypothetical protein
MRPALLLAFLLASAPPGHAQQEMSLNAVAAAPAAGPITIDGVLEEPAWATAGTIAGLTQQEPEPSKPTPFDATRISVLTDGQTLYFGLVCPDPEPEKIAVHTLQRDADMEGDDSVAFVLDTFGDGRTGYFFRVNAGGARRSGGAQAAVDVGVVSGASGLAIIGVRGMLPWPRVYTSAVPFRSRPT